MCADKKKCCIPVGDDDDEEAKKREAHERVVFYACRYALIARLKRR